jgi:transcription-repair coupling factor (superfamily II helicase)
MYLKLLSQAINQENGVEIEDDIPCTVDLNISAHIPESYISSLPARLGIYKRIAAIRTDDDASDVIDELCDRFGDPPKAVMGLIDIATLRSKAAKAKIYEITANGNTAFLHINSIESEVMSKISSHFGNRFMLKMAEKPIYTVRLKPNQKLSDFISELSNAL